MDKYNKKGFTLVELLVVITIIAILASIGLVMYSGVQKSGRIAKRIGDLKAIQTALELYHSRNGSYPATCSTGVGCVNFQSECSQFGGFTSDKVIPGLIPTYMVAFPKDPSMQQPDKGCYAYTSDGANYKLMDHYIPDFDANRSDPTGYLSQRNLIDPLRDGGTLCGIVDGTAPWAWAVYSDPSICW